MNWFRLQEIMPVSDSNMVKGVMNLFDCFMDEFNDPKHVESLSDLDIRAQVEVSYLSTILTS